MAPNETDRDKDRTYRPDTQRGDRTTAEDANETGTNTGTDQPDKGNTSEPQPKNRP